MRRFLLAGLGTLLVACGAEASPTDVAGEVVVFAAASLSDVLEELATEFSANGGGRVALNLAGSQTLAAQILEGTPADLFISADAAQMDRVAAAGRLSEDPIDIATNTLAIAVEAGNPRGVTGLADLPRRDLSVVLAAEEVPAGRYAADVLDRADVRVHPVSLERSVRAALAKVAQGEADAAIVFASDLVAARHRGAAVEGIEIPAPLNVVATYPLGQLSAGPSPDAARAFATFLRSERGRALLVAHGFGAP